AASISTRRRSRARQARHLLAPDSVREPKGGGMRKRRKPAVEVVNDNVAEPLTEQDRLTMAEYVDDYRRAQITRRDFVQRSAAFGLSVGSLGAILAEVGPVAGSAEAAVRQGRLGKLAVGLESDADTLDPQAFRSVTGYHVTGNIYDSLGYH